MENKTFQDILKETKESKNGKVTRSLVMKDVPVILIEKFCYNIGTEYNDIYWVKLQDLVRKAEMYDYLISMQNMANYASPGEEEQEPEPVHAPKPIITLGDTKK